MLLHPDKEHLQIAAGNLIPTGERLHVFPLRSGTTQGHLLLPLLFNIVGSDQCNQAKKRNKIHSDWKGRNKTDIIIYLFHLVVSTKSY